MPEPETKTTAEKIQEAGNKMQKMGLKLTLAITIPVVVSLVFTPWVGIPLGVLCIYLAFKM